MLIWALNALAHAKQPMPANGFAINVVSRPIPLNSEAPKDTKLGFLTYQGGVELVATQSYFGGLSGLVVAQDESHFIAITDKGAWVCGALNVSASGTLQGIDSPWMARLRSLESVDMDKKENADSEALAFAHDRSAAYVSFEGRHRVWRYDVDDATDLCSVAASTPARIPLPKGVDELPNNGGIESLDALPSGKLVMIGEDKLRSIKAQPGWVGNPSDGYKAFTYAAPSPFQPTDMKAVPGGYVILHRHFSMLSGVSGAIGWAARAQGSADPGPVKMLAQFAPPISVDNFEGLSVLPDGKGGYMIYIISDDNFSPFQRTLLMKFSLSKDAFIRAQNRP